MHAFSDMRRNSTYQNFVTTSIFLIFLIIYNAFSGIYLFLPPLFGVLFLYFVALLEGKRYYAFSAFLVVLCVFEADKGFYPGVLFVIYSLVYMFLFNKTMKIFVNFNLFEVFYAPIIYISCIILSNFIALIFGDEFRSFTLLVWFYMIIEIFLTLVIRWILGIK